MPFVLLLFALTSTVFAAENNYTIANIDKDRSSYVIDVPAPPPLVIETIEYYEIQGGTEKDLRCDISQKGCKWEDGKTYDSVTSWSLTFDYGNEQARPVCNPEDITVTLEVTFRYPKWVTMADAPQPLVNKWNAYLQSLIVHESGHRDMAVTAATEISNAVLKLPAGQSCSELERTAQRLSRERMNKLKADSKKYDVATDHGIRQGASFQ